MFQLFAALLEPNSTGALPEHYQALLPPLLQLTTWEVRGNVPGYTRLLAAIIPRAASLIVAQNQVEPILGIFQYLVQGKKTEQNGFDILEAVVLSMPKYVFGLFLKKISGYVWHRRLTTSPRNVLEQYFTTILQVLLTKLDRETQETSPYRKRFVLFYHLVSAKTEAGLGADWFISQVDAIQSNIFTPIYLKTILPTSTQLIRPLDRKLAVISFAKTLAESQAFAERYKKGWGFTCQTMLTLLANVVNVAGAGGDDVVQEADVDDIGFGLGFTPLSTCKKAARDEFPDVQDAGQWVRQYLTQANAAKGGAIMGSTDRLSPEGQQAFAQFMTAS